MKVVRAKVCVCSPGKCSFPDVCPDPSYAKLVCLPKTERYIKPDPKRWRQSGQYWKYQFSRDDLKLAKEDARSLCERHGLKNTIAFMRLPQKCPVCGAKKTVTDRDEGSFLHCPTLDAWYECKAHLSAWEEKYQAWDKPGAVCIEFTRQCGGEWVASRDRPIIRMNSKKSKKS